MNAIIRTNALDDAELATVLAALRFYQRAGMGDPDNRDDDIHDIATGGGEVMSSLDDDGIDALCERLNGVAPVAPQSDDMEALRAALRDMMRATERVYTKAACKARDEGHAVWLRTTSAETKAKALQWAQEHKPKVIPAIETFDDAIRAFGTSLLAEVARVHG